MPNLNVKGESSKPSAAPGGGGGGTSKVLLTIVIAVVAVGAVLFILNTTGVVKLWGKKKPAPVVVDVPVENPQPIVQEAAPVNEPKPVDKKETVEPSKLESNASVKKMVVTGTGMYTIQIASWPDEKRANEQAQVFQDAGFEAFVEPLGSYFRVCVGRFESKKEARKKAESMEHMLESMYVIAKVGN